MGIDVVGIPAELTAEFLVGKGILALIGVLLLLWHMNHEWSNMRHGDQRARVQLAGRDHRQAAGRGRPARGPRCAD